MVAQVLTQSHRVVEIWYLEGEFELEHASENFSHSEAPDSRGIIILVIVPYGLSQYNIDRCLGIL